MYTTTTTDYMCFNVFNLFFEEKNKNSKYDIADGHNFTATKELESTHHTNNLGSILVHAPDLVVTVILSY